MNGELLQGLNWLCNKGLSEEGKTVISEGAQHPRNLDPPLLPCYFPAESLLFQGYDKGDDAWRPFPEVT